MKGLPQFSTKINVQQTVGNSLPLKIFFDLVIENTTYETEKYCMTLIGYTLLSVIKVFLIEHNACLVPRERRKVFVR